MPDLSRITLDPDICHGKPCIRHMRWPVEVILDLVSSGMGINDILADHSELDREDLLACLHYARLLVSGEAHFACSHTPYENKQRSDDSGAQYLWRSL